jgi:nitrogenase molybdenum-iron protein alpha/beta subunit
MHYMKSEIVYPYSLGIYLVVNSIPDSYLVMDGPTCCFYRADFIQGNHDMSSNLLNCSGLHRVLNTCADVDNIVLDRSGAVREILENLRDNPLCKCIFTAALPMSYLTGVQYDAIIREVEDGSGAPIYLMPHRSLQSDWLAGYADSLKAIASNLDVSGGDQRPDRVGIIGYFMDRGEEDHLANIREMKRLLAALSLRTVSIWLSGEPFDALRQIRDAGVIIALPHGREAAQTIADRTGARLLETALPFGLEGTSNWLREVAAFTGKEAEAENFIAEELGQAARKIEWILPNGFIGRRFLPVCDPHLIGGFVDILRELGGEVTLAYATGEGSLLEEEHSGVQIVRRMDLARLDGDIQRLQREGGLDLAVCNTFFLGIFQRLGIPFLEFGFPSHTEHCLYSRPYLGYRGYLSLVEQMYNRMQLFRMLKQ